MCLTLRPIGTVTAKMEDDSEIEIYPRFSPGLNGIERHSHLQVLFWMHKLSESDRKILEAYPMGDRTKEKRGVFALRSPMRPNPIGLTKVSLKERRGNVLLVSRLDAFADSPVLDIKPG